ncbi:hypothetical protein [Moorena producens]|uniref:hypothetical protein n=1 Tax=Moorena producens TaxID=1155739 RepID=UPI003C742BC4
MSASLILQGLQRVDKSALRSKIRTLAYGLLLACLLPLASCLLPIASMPLASCLLPLAHC